MKITLSDRTRFQHRIGYVFRDPSLLELALTHSSHGGPVAGRNNERLEFLGDSVLDLLTAQFLYTAHPTEREGFMSQTRAELVKKGALAARARELHLGELMLVHERQNHIRHEKSVLADCLEAVIGAVFLDGGLEAARTVVQAAMII